MAEGDRSHVHSEECIVLARIRLRVMRSEIELNQAIVRAYEAHTATLVDAVMSAERSTTRLNINDILRVIPSMTPPPLRRQTNMTNTNMSAFTFSDNDINNLNDEDILPQ